jgi:hypothetical protein
MVKHIIANVLVHHPKQSVWLVVPPTKSKDRQRASLVAPALWRVAPWPRGALLLERRLAVKGGLAVGLGLSLLARSGTDPSASVWAMLALVTKSPKPATIYMVPSHIYTATVYVPTTPVRARATCTAQATEEAVGHTQRIPHPYQP